MTSPLVDNQQANEGYSETPFRSHVPEMSYNRLPLLIAGSLFLGSLILYLSTLAPSVVTLFDDSLEFQLVTYRLGIAHPTGYPLYTLLGKLFTFLPVGNIAYRVNLMSAVFGAATVSVLCLLIMQESRIVGPKAFDQQGSLRTSLPSYLGSLSGALFLAVSPVFWHQATIAEVYTLNAFFVATILLLAVIPLPTEQSQTRLLWLAFGVGLSLTHHRTMLLLLPAMAVYLLIIYKKEPFSSKTLVRSVLWGILPLLLYLYLPLRGHIGSLDGTYQNSWAGFWQHVSGGGYGTFIFDNPFGQEREATFYLKLLTDQFYTLLPGVAGLLWLILSRSRNILILTGLGFIIYFIFNVFYQVTDIEVFFIPIFVIWAVWSGVGAVWLLQTTIAVKHKVGSWLLTSLLLVYFGVAIGRSFSLNRSQVTESYTWQIHDYGLDILQQPLPQDKSVIAGILGEMTLVRYFQETEGLRNDVETIAADLEADRLAVVERSLNEGKAVYLTRELPGAGERWSLNAVGPLIRVHQEPVMQPPNISHKLERRVTDSIMLLGYEVSRPPHTGMGAAPVRLTLLWQATSVPARDLKVSARLLDAGREPVTGTDAVPVHFAYPTTAWRRGEIIMDVYDLILPVDAPQGSYQPLIIWYDPDQNAAEIGRVTLEAIWVE